SVTLYLDKTTTDAQAQLLQRQAQEQAGDVDVVYVDRAMALKRLRTDLGDLAGSLDGLSQNPLPPSLEVTPRASLQPSGVPLHAGMLLGIGLLVGLFGSWLAFARFLRT